MGCNSSCFDNLLYEDSFCCHIALSAQLLHDALFQTDILIYDQHYKYYTIMNSTKLTVDMLPFPTIKYSFP